MKRSISLLCGAVLLCQALCSAHDQFNDGAEALKLKSLLSSIRASTTLKPHTSDSIPARTQSSLASVEEDRDYNFQSDRLPALTMDEFNNLAQDANPLHFLKQLAAAQPESTTVQVESMTEPVRTQAESFKPQTGRPEPAPGTPIYITIPIYINTSGKLPVRLIVGDQEMALQRRLPAHRNSHSTKSPNSHFNRLLEQIQPPRRRTTNRHRSQSRNKIPAPHESHSPAGH